MRVIEYSEDMLTWKTFMGPGPNELVDTAWPHVRQWIYKEQIYGFFRIVDFYFISPTEPDTVLETGSADAAEGNVAEPTPK